MSMVRFDLDNELDELRRELNPFYSGTAGLPGLLASAGGRTRFVPAMDTVVRDGAVVLTVDLPGVEEQDIDVEIQGDTLKIRGKRVVEEQQADDTWYRSERSVGTFERSLRLPEAIDASSVNASFAQGVLTVRVPLPSRAVSSPQKVEIESA